MQTSGKELASHKGSLIRDREGSEASRIEARITTLLRLDSVPPHTSSTPPLLPLLEVRHVSRGTT